MWPHARRRCWTVVVIEKSRSFSSFCSATDGHDRRQTVAVDASRRAQFDTRQLVCEHTELLIQSTDSILNKPASKKEYL